MKYRVVDVAVYNGSVGEILEAEYEPILQEYIYKISRPFFGYLWLKEQDIKLLNLICDCGAKYDREFPDVHMHMCNHNKS